MSFASDARGELAREKVEQPCCARAEVAAALLFGGGVAYIGREKYRLRIASPDAFVARHFFVLLKNFFGITAELSTTKTDQLRQTRYQVAPPDEDSAAILEACGLLDAEALFGVRAVPKESALAYACCRKAFLRGAFLLAGAVSDPERAYHLEFAAPSEELADHVIMLLNYFEISAKKTCRKSKFVVYLKGGEQIADALTLIGAKNAMMTLENVRVKKDVRNRINRQLNCDERNMARQIENAQAQLADIELIRRKIGLDRLPASLREMARVRAEHAEDPLAALGEFCDPPIGKSGVNSRLRRLKQIAASLREGEEDI